MMKHKGCGGIIVGQKCKRCEKKITDNSQMVLEGEE